MSPISPTPKFPTGRLLAVVEGHTRAVNSLALRLDGKLLASASSDKTVRMWDLGSHSRTLTLRGHRGEVMSLDFSPDGKLLASGSSFDFQGHGPHSSRPQTGP